MTTKEKLLELFDKSKGIYFSGEELAKKLNVSRAAINKAVNALRGDGYSIDAVTNKGYCLSEKTDILSCFAIEKYLDKNIEKPDINVIPTIDSTNNFVKKKAAEGACQGLIVISNEQTKGRGRYGRSFVSPKNTGIYMSLLLRPLDYSAKDAARITTMAAVAMCEAIEDVSELSPKIKWVNDIFVNGKKVCGILTEASFDIESSNLDYAVLGLGINIYNPEDDFPDDIKNIAGALFECTRDDIKNKLVAAFINNFYKYYKQNDHSEYTKKYRSYSLVIGKKVTIVGVNTEKNALVLGIDDECRLKVQYDNGEKETLSYGEIRIKI